MQMSAVSARWRVSANEVEKNNNTYYKEDLAGSKEKDYRDSVSATGGVVGEIFGALEHGRIWKLVLTTSFVT